jgi:hypothetical protein
MNKSINIKKVNNETIKVIPVTKTDPKSIKGYDIIPILYANIFICAQKRSGKTNLINKILDSCIDSNTKVIVFASTHDLDDNWKYIKKQLEKKKINAIYYSSIEEGNTNNLQEVLAFMSNDLTSQEEEKEENPNDLIEVIKFDGKKSYKLKLKPIKKKTPKFIIIFDDMSMELKKRNVAGLLKTFRHYKSKVIVSTQWPNDLPPDARKQFDFFLLFKGHSKDKMEELYNDMGINIPFEEMYEIYKKVTEKPYEFLYINQHTCEMREKFDKEILISK